MVLSNQPMPYVGNGCPYCGAGWDEQKIVDHESYERSGTALYEYGHCLRCNTDYKLRYVATHWVGDNGIHHPLSLVTAEPELPMAKAVYPAVVNDLLERVSNGQSKYGCVLSTHNGRSALQDVYEEIMDALLYLKQHFMEGGQHTLIERIMTRDEWVSQMLAGLDKLDIDTRSRERLGYWLSDPDRSREFMVNKEYVSFDVWARNLLLTRKYLWIRNFGKLSNERLRAAIAKYLEANDGIESSPGKS